MKIFFSCKIYMLSGFRNVVAVLFYVVYALLCCFDVIKYTILTK